MKKMFILVFSLMVLLSSFTPAYASSNTEDITRNLPSNFKEIEVEVNLQKDRGISSSERELIRDNKLSKEIPNFSSFIQSTSSTDVGGALPYSPSSWEPLTDKANCYGYMLNAYVTGYSGDVRQILLPGLIGGDAIKNLTKAEIVSSVKADGEVLGFTFRESSYSEVPGANEYKVALVTTEDTDLEDGDYHWYRQDSDSGWSHKRGLTPISYKDDSDEYISSPRLCDRGDYTVWCGYYILTPDYHGSKLNIQVQ